MDIQEIRRHNSRLLASRFKTLTDFAEALDRAPTYVSRFLGKNPTRGIGGKIAREIETVFGKPHGWLDIYHESLDDTAPPAGTQNIALANELAKAKSIPVVSWVQAGTFCDSAGAALPVDETTEYVSYFGPISDQAYGLTVKGDSMVNPHGGQMTFLTGCRVIVDPGKVAEPGHYVVVRLPGSNEVTFKQLVQDGGQLFLKPLNPQYPTIDFPINGHVCGVVVGIAMSL